MKKSKQVAEKWVRNSITANVDKVYGIVEAYFNGTQSLNWTVGALKSDDFENQVSRILKSFHGIDDFKFDALVSALTD